MKHTINIESASLSMSKHSMMASNTPKSPIQPVASNPWNLSKPKFDEDVYSKNLDKMAKNLIKKMKHSISQKEKLTKHDEDHKGKDLDRLRRINLNKPEKQRKRSRDRSREDTALPKETKTGKRKNKSKEKNVLKGSISMATLKLNKKISTKKLKLDKSHRSKARSKKNSDVETCVPNQDSPIIKCKIEIPQCSGDPDDSELVSMRKQFESIYSSQDLMDYKTEPARTQDSRCPPKPPKNVKKKSLKKKSDKKMNLNFKSVNSSIKRKKRKSSRSKTRGSASKKGKGSQGQEDFVDGSMNKKKLYGIRSSFSPTKEYKATVGKAKNMQSSQTYSKPNLSLSNVANKGRKKIQLKNKHNIGRPVIKKDKIKGTITMSNNYIGSNTKSKNSEKSPRQFDDKASTHEIPTIYTSKRKTSPIHEQGVETKEKGSKLKSKSKEKVSEAVENNEDFLSFVEKHEKLHQMNKNRRLKTKDSSLASTNTGNTNSVAGFTNKITKHKLNRPFSGEPVKINKNSTIKLSIIPGKTSIISYNISLYNEIT